MCGVKAAKKVMLDLIERCQNIHYILLFMGLDNGAVVIMLRLMIREVLASDMFSLFETD